MQVSGRWRIAALVTGALIVGSAFGPPLARAASASLIRLEGGDSTHVAKVSKSGRLSVNTGLPVTSAGEVAVAPASPRSLVTIPPTGASCAAGGIYTVPAGMTLIITSVEFTAAVSTATGTYLGQLEDGPTATPCRNLIAMDFGAQQPVSSQNEVFPSGIAVPAGDSIGLTDNTGIVSAFIYGYLARAS